VVGEAPSSCSNGTHLPQDAPRPPVGFSQGLQREMTRGVHTIHHKRRVHTAFLPPLPWHPSQRSCRPGRPGSRRSCEHRAPVCHSPPVACNDVWSACNAIENIKFPKMSITNKNYNHPRGQLGEGSLVLVNLDAPVAVGISKLAQALWERARQGSVERKRKNDLILCPRSLILLPPLPPPWRGPADLAHSIPARVCQQVLAR